MDFSSDDRRTEALITFLKFLPGVAIIYGFAVGLFVLESTMGIKRSILKLYKGKS